MLQILPLIASNAEDIVTWNKNKDASFLQQWAGRRYAYPLTSEQIIHRLEQQAELACELFQITDDVRVIGTIELIKTGENSDRAGIGRFLLNPGKTGMGYGTKALKLFLRMLFYERGFETIWLRVFTFNTVAIRCYEKAGFRETERETLTNGWVALTMEVKREHIVNMT